MKSFIGQIKQTNFILQIAEQAFSQTLFEKEDDTNDVYYRKGKQFILISHHALVDGKARNRVWWDDKNPQNDPDFVNFADECLDLLKDNKLAIKYPEFPAVEYGEVCFADKSDMKGWVTSLRYSDESKTKLDSFNIVTILDKESGSMDLSKPLFAKNRQDFVITLNKFKSKNEHSAEKESASAALKEVSALLAELSDALEYAKMELEDDPSDKDARKKVKSLTNQVKDLENRKAKLQKQSGEVPTNESFIVEEIATKR